MMQRELTLALLELAGHFARVGYPDATLFALAAAAVPHDPGGLLARAALEAFERDRAFSGEDVHILSRLEALLADIAALIDSNGEEA
ncbi:MAG TPA: hypothetical protein VNO34_01940 [Actinomycetota bacterium]|nr:hypothetical protein [Actinomycetota bacterium]